MLEIGKTGLATTGFYRGIVKQRLTNGRCKIWIPGVYPAEFESTPESLPDAQQAAPLFAVSDSLNGTYSYPEVGTIVWCFFENNDISLPVYFAATHEKVNSADPFERVNPIGNASNVKQIKVDDVTIDINTEDDSIVISNPNATISIAKNGDMKMSGNNLTLDFQNIRISANKTNIVNEYQTNIISPCVNVNGNRFNVFVKAGATIRGKLRDLEVV